MKHTAAELQKRGCSSVMLWTLKTNPVRDWYEKMGGKVLDEKSSSIEGQEIVEIAYGWDTLSSLLPVSAGKK